MLSPAGVRAFYDRFGTKQDAQAFYEDPALDDLILHAHFPGAERVFEFGCGTGRFAARLLEEYLPEWAEYTACDFSETMFRIARDRLAALAERVEVVQSAGTMLFPIPDHSVDRVIATYVLDLLGAAQIAEFLAESLRVLSEGGRLCLVSLTHGVSPVSKAVAWIWNGVYRVRPAWVGGCRPISLAQLVDPAKWQAVHHNVVTAFGIPSEVLVAEAK